MRISPEQYFQENGTYQANTDYYPILLGVVIGGLIAITVIALMYKK